MTTIALIVAAGRGARMGEGRPKQYLELAGRPVISHTIAAFAGNPLVDDVRVVIHPNDIDLYRASTEDLEILEPVNGSSNRQASVLLGLESLRELAPHKVLIHDGARPLVKATIINRIIAALDATPGAIAAIPVRDTLKRERKGSTRIKETIDRTGLWRAQTPQGFHFDDILSAHHASKGLDLTDDAAVAEHADLAVALVEDREDNLKITTVMDLAQAELALIGSGDIRVGSGFDVHKFGQGDHIRLCGIDIPYTRALIGHSDADVGLHALTDALLGAAGDGDIGVHFPPSDARWAAADSAIFVQFAANKIQEKRGRISHIDLTIICQDPKIGPFRSVMVARLAKLLGISEERVNVKATTTEGLGFTGRGEGIAAQATATLILPGFSR